VQKAGAPLSKVTVIDTSTLERNDPRGDYHGRWETIRIRCRRNGEKIKTVARDLGLAPKTVRAYLRKDSPPKRKPRADVETLTRYQSHIDSLILFTPKITAARIGSYLRQNVDSDLVADERTLRRYVAGRRAVLVPKEAFIRATYGPGEQSQFDFSPMSVRLAGVVVVIQLFVLRLSYSGRFMARASMRCDRPALFAGLLAGFTVFGGVTRSSAIATRTRSSRSFVVVLASRSNLRPRQRQ
jgi:transposase